MKMAECVRRLLEQRNFYQLPSKKPEVVVDNRDIAETIRQIEAARVPTKDFAEKMLGPVSPREIQKNPASDILAELGPVASREIAAIWEEIMRKHHYPTRAAMLLDLTLMSVGLAEHRQLLTDEEVEEVRGMVHEELRSVFRRSA
jgi:hypothetical protein